MPQFSDYKGMLGDFDSGVEYFLNLFLSVNENPDKVNTWTRTVTSKLTCHHTHTLLVP